MPIYEYACPSCGGTFEELVFGDADPPCPECGSSQAARLMSRACFHSGGGSDYGDAANTHSGGSCGCGGCSGGNCASCC
ncbi:MAG: zinc ribbon domain-containing protein [Desulfovibrio sp.]|jgi:putative FmdB family regulatory protein|nr:zinc ribbon domain-containing protein [Desulfovibrio sp.]